MSLKKYAKEITRIRKSIDSSAIPLFPLALDHGQYAGISTNKAAKLLDQPYKP